MSPGVTYFRSAVLVVAALIATLARGQDPRRPDADPLREQIELQQQQIDTLKAMVDLLQEELSAPPATESMGLQDKLDLLEARSERSAQRDAELASQVDDLRESLDAQQRQDPALPPTLRETFLPTRTNQSPVTLYGTLATGYADFEDQSGNFTSPTFSPHFYMLLNEKFLFEINPDITSNQVDVDSAQIDWFVHDNLTAVLGRFYSPIGFFNERLHTSWIYKTPDRPLMFQQVLPAGLSLNGLQFRGAQYLGDRPVKVEYSTFLANGLSQNTRTPNAKDFADFLATGDPFNDVNDDKAIGGRVGLSFPQAGIVVGVSGMENGAYDRAGVHDVTLWDTDFSYHFGNWDVRFEYAEVHQQASPGPIDRRGLYAQAAYRPYDSVHAFWNNVETVFRYGHVEFQGIDLAATGTDFGSTLRIPIDRDQYTFGVNYYLYPALVTKFAYEINDELSFRELNDDAFLFQVTWGF